MTQEINILFIGDIVGKPGRKALFHLLSRVKGENNIDFCIANGENAAGGNGITPPVAEELFAGGVDLITSGNHIWDKKEVNEIIDENPNLLRPFNYPPGTPGSGAAVFQTCDKVKVGVINLAGRVFMANLDCPFRTGEEAIAELKKTTPIILIDIHAEATAEKMAIGWHFDGHVSAVIGTHTHVQTADERILPGGTAFITDAGMTGSMNSVIGVDRKRVIQRFLTQMPVKFHPAGENLYMSGVIIKIDAETAKSVSIERFLKKAPDS